MKREDIDLIQRWLYYDQLDEQAVHNRIEGYGIKNLDVSAAIKIAKLQKQYEQGHIHLDKLKEVFVQYDIKVK